MGYIWTTIKKLGFPDWILRFKGRTDAKYFFGHAIVTDDICLAGLFFLTELIDAKETFFLKKRWPN